MKFLVVAAILSQSAFAAVNPNELNRVKLMGGSRATMPVPTLVTESLIEVDGRRYHSVEYQGLVFYFPSLTNAQQSKNSAPLCHQFTSMGLDKISHKTVETRVTHVAQAFVENLENHCQKVEHFTSMGLGARMSSPSRVKDADNVYEDILGFKSDF